MTTAEQVPQISPEQAGQLAAQGALLLDVREPDEWSAGHIPDATHVPLGALDPSTIPADRVVVAVCRSGNRSGKAAARLAQAGIGARNLSGGMRAWAHSGGSVHRDDGTAGTVA
jgi:rhodanese-related sulfurtransferase